MQLKVFTLLLLFAPLVFISCGDDDDSATDTLEKALPDISGTYAGYTTADIKYSSEPMVFGGETLVVTVNDDGTANLHLDSQYWNTTVERATVTEDGEAYTITGSASCIITSPIHETSSDPYPGEVTATISRDKTEAEMVLTLPGVMGGTTVTFRTGEAPE